MLTRSRSRSSEMSDSPENTEGSQDSPSLSQLDSAPKDNYVPKKRNRRGPPRKADRWVCIMPEAFHSLQMGETESAPEKQLCNSLVLLKDPSSNKPRRFLYKASDCEPGCGDLCEIVKFADQPRSWFIGNTIQTDGSLYIFTPVDPLFLALPYLVEAAKVGNYKSLDDLMEDDSCPDAFQVLSSCVRPNQWTNICDIKSMGESSFYRLNRERAIAWLKKKVNALAERLEEERVYVGSGARSLALADSKQLEVTQGSYSTYACGMICDYLTADMKQELINIYGVDDVKTSSKRKAAEGHAVNGTSEPSAKKPCLSNNSEPLEDYSTGKNAPPPPTKAKKLTSAQKTLAKINKKGMKSLSSFFKKKATN